MLNHEWELCELVCAQLLEKGELDGIAWVVESIPSGPVDRNEVTLFVSS